MADSVDRVFGHALNTVNKIRPGSQKPPASDRLALYGLYKQSMEGDVSTTFDRPTSSTLPNISSELLQKEQEKWESWKDNEGLSRTEAKRRYIEKLIETMHKYASHTDEARQLVEELEFVWDQVKSNSQHSSSEQSSPLQAMDRSGYLQAGGSSGETGGISSSAAALDGMGQSREGGLRVLSPVSQEGEVEMEERDEFVDAPVSQVDMEEGIDRSPSAGGAEAGAKESRPVFHRRRMQNAEDPLWRKRVEAGLIKLTTEVAALREQLENRRFIKAQRRGSFLGWILRIGWWGVQLVIADAVVLWIVILFMRRKQDRRLEGAVRVLLGDAVAQVQKVKIPTLPRLAGKKNG